ncbi:FMN-binding negative transcriptional regulator [Marinobacter sp.]|uniref:FMN-binding negative transcriptional regulator n=1 Tax=Marinobacter sp. TaxID=50741 RepID=UPI003F986D32
MLGPSHFKEENQEKLQQYIKDYSFGTLRCHVARANPVWQRIENGASVFAIFQGPDACVSPSWYETKADW